MPRRYRRYRRYFRNYKLTKYSNETHSTAATNTWLSNTTYWTECIPDTSVLGTRKVKNFSLSLSLLSAEDVPIFWALVYVPEGTESSQLNFGNQGAEVITTTSMYEPNQNVIMQGVLDNKQSYKFRTPLARNLNSGDTVQFVFRPVSNFSGSSTLALTLNFALAY